LFKKLLEALQKKQIFRITEIKEEISLQKEKLPQGYIKRRKIPTTTNETIQIIKTIKEPLNFLQQPFK
ncbi:2434_t:CDS:1, partial [Gigaspora rosea]